MNQDYQYWVLLQMLPQVEIQALQFWFGSSVTFNEGILLYEITSSFWVIY